MKVRVPFLQLFVVLDVPLSQVAVLATASAGAHHA